MNKIKFRKALQTQLLNYLTECEDIIKWAVRKGADLNTYRDTLAVLFGPRYTVEQVAKKLDRSPQWVTLKARVLGLGTKEGWYGTKDRYWFHEPDIRELRAAKRDAKIGRPTV